MRHDTSLRTLIELVKLGARRRLVPLSTSELGRVLQLTQQGASVRLLELEKDGMIERGRVGRRLGVRLTSRGYDEVTSLYAELKGVMNLRLVSPTQIDQKRLLRSMTGIYIEGFEDRARSYGPARCFRARIGERQKGAALVIERTHYDDTVLELISPVNLRRELKLKDGDELSATVHLE